MSPVQQSMANRNKHFVIAAAVITAGLWVALVFYVLVESQHVHVTVQPGAVAVHAPSPVATVSSSARFRHSTPMLLQHNSYSMPEWSLLPSSTPMSGTSTMRIHQTSDATVHSVGGGGSGFGIATTNGQSSSRGISSSISYGGNMLALSSSLALAAPGAGNATSLASTTEAPRDVLRARKVDPFDPPLDPFPDPVGDVAWGLMLLLTTAWCVRVRLRRQ